MPTDFSLENFVVTIFEVKATVAQSQKALDTFMALRHITSMTKTEFKKLREGAGHTHESLAAAMGVHLRTVWRWELGETVIPKVVELALRYVAEHAAKVRDATDLIQARASLKEAKQKGTVPWEVVKKASVRKSGRQKH